MDMQAIQTFLTTTAIDLDDGTASLDLAYDVAAYFELNAKETRLIARRVAASTSKWRAEAAKLGLTTAEIERMAAAFEHADLKAALSGKG